jgi:hypothetical protein
MFVNSSTVDYCKLLEFFNKKEFSGLHPSYIIDIFCIYEYKSSSVPDMKFVNECSEVIKGLDCSLYNKVKNRSSALRYRSQRGYYALRDKFIKKAIDDVGLDLKISAFYPG